MSVNIQLRRGTAAAWTSANPTLAAGEPGLETDTGKFKWGDGTTAWNSLAYIGATIDWAEDGDIAAVGTAAAANAGTEAAPAGHVHPHEAAHVAHDTVWAAKGDLIAATANDTAAVTSVGADYARLQALASASNGIAWGGRGHQIILTSDQTRTASTNTLADVTGLTLALPSSLSALSFMWFGFYQSTNTACGINLSINCGGGSPAFYKKVQSGSGPPSFTEATVGTLDGGNATTSVDAANADRYFFVQGYITDPTGTFACRYANEVNTGPQVTIKDGSALILWFV